MLVALSLALRHELRDELVSLTPAVLAVDTALIAGAAVVVAKIGVAAFFPMFLVALFPFLMRLESRSRDPDGAWPGSAPHCSEKDHARRRSR